MGLSIIATAFACVTLLTSRPLSLHQSESYVAAMAIDFSVDGNDPLSSLCSGKLRTYGASSRVDMSLTPSQTLPFDAYKHLVEGFRAPKRARL